MPAFFTSKSDQLIEGRQIFLQVALKNKKGKDSELRLCLMVNNETFRENFPGESPSKALLLLTI